MLGKEYTFKQKIEELREREKELKSIYRVEEAIQLKLPFDQFFNEIIKRIPGGWQYPEICRVKITYNGSVYREPGWEESEWKQESPIEIDEKVSGKIEIFYTAFRKMIIDTQFLPEEQKLLNTIATRISRYLFNLQLENTLNLLHNNTIQEEQQPEHILPSSHDSHWIWRKKMAEIIVSKMDFEKFGVKGVYLIGSTKTAEAGPASDIDLLIHISDEPLLRIQLIAWMEGWSLCLSEMNYEKTGYHTDGLLDIHLVTDEDIKKKTSYAVMIGSPYNSAKPLKVKEN
ncbi:MAG: nucleotidyltransferase domain-containing protein [Bacteroidales bacterium]